MRRTLCRDWLAGLAVAAVSGLAGTAQAVTMTQVHGIASVPHFDASLGTLTSVLVEFDADASANARVTNNGTGDVTATLGLTLDATLSMPFGLAGLGFRETDFESTTVAPGGADSLNVFAFDGNSASFTSPGDLANFIGDPSSNIPFPVTNNSFDSVSISPDPADVVVERFPLNIAFRGTVTYTYEEATEPPPPPPTRAIPEPVTAGLSLLSLAGLALTATRRRAV